MRVRVERVVFAVTCALVMSASACATSNQGGGRKTYVVVCDEKAPTGSNIGRLKCYRKTDMDERRARDRAEMERALFDSKRPAAVSGPAGR